MFRPSAKGVAGGVAVFALLVGAGLIASNALQLDPTSAPFSVVYLVAWIVPGYVAARIAGRNGVANGAVVGIVVALIAGVATQLFFNSPPPGQESDGSTSVAVVVGLGSITLCSLGGLVCELQWRAQK